MLLLDGTNVNHTLVKGGWCWRYRKYAPGNAELEKLETEAREVRRGLWTDPHPVPPWEWRNRGMWAARGRLAVRHVLGHRQKPMLSFATVDG